MDVIWAVALLTVLCLGWLTNIVGLPGNWFVLAATAVYWLLMPAEASTAIGMPLILGMAGLALLGELVEFVAGSAGVAKAGGSRRSALYAIVGSIGGAIVGLFVGVPIPVIGSLVASLLFGSIGAMAGAIFGERSVGRNWNETFQVGSAAFWGRAFGTLGKMAVGLAMLVLALIGAIF